MHLYDILWWHVDLIMNKLSCYQYLDKLMLLTCHRNILYKQTPNFKYATPLKKVEEVESNEIYFIFKFFFFRFKENFRMRQLKGKVKETKKEKRERKADNLKNKDKVWTVVLPVILTISVIIIAYVLLSTKALWF